MTPNEIHDFHIQGFADIGEDACDRLSCFVLANGRNRIALGGNSHFFTLWPRVMIKGVSIAREPPT
jgi:hypothetical protein